MKLSINTELPEFLVYKLSNLDKIDQKITTKLYKIFDYSFGAVILQFLTIPIMVMYLGNKKYIGELILFTILELLPLIFVSLFLADNFRNYYRKKLGFNFYQNEIIGNLKDKDYQRTIVLYCNNMGQKNPELASNNDTLKQAFIEENYPLVLQTMQKLLIQIDYIVKYEEAINIQKNQIVQFEKELGISSDNENEINCSLKIYL